MGDPGRKHKKYSKPKKKFELARIKEEEALIQKYGLKNKKELWKAEFKIDKIRRQAKEIISKPHQTEQLVSKLKVLGFKVGAIDDFLALTKENLLERRLQTVLVRKGFAKTLKEARQLVVHKHVFVSKNIVNIPSFIVPTALEDEISLVKKQKKEKSAVIKSEEGMGGGD